MPLAGVRVLVLFGGNRIFGSERSNFEVFRNMAQLGLKARFITSSRWGRHEIQPELDRLGFEWTTAPFGFHWTRHMLGRHFGYFLLNLYGLAATSLRVWWEVRRWKPTHVYSPGWMYYSFAMPAICWSNLPLIFRAGDEPTMHSWLHRWFMKSLVRRTVGMVCISDYIRESYAKIGMARERMRVIYNYPPERATNGVVQSPKVPPGALVLVFAGQVSEHKGVGVLIDAVERLIKRGENLVLWVVGDAPWDHKGYFSSLKQRVAAAGLEQRIVFLGFLKDVFPVLARSDVLVCPSLFAEPLSNVVGEAKRFAKPSVVFPSGGLPELIEHGVDGYICRDKSVEALMEGIEYFLGDAVKRQVAGLAAKKSLEEKFGLQRYRAQWCGVFSGAS